MMSDQLSSWKWLKAHGLEATGLSLSQILCSLGFQQCTGEVQSLGRAVASKYSIGLFLQHPDQDGHVYNLVNADENKLSELEARLTALIASLKRRLQWLNSGSRKTCGVLSEKRVLLALLGGRKAKRRADPSSTIRAVIDLLKEQGTSLTHLNILSGIATWKQQLTEVNDEVIVEARQWLLDTTPSFTQDTVSSLIGALTDKQLEAVYLIVEGGQMKEDLSDLAGKVLEQHLSIPVHVIVVDCKCSTVLEICQKLASASGGRCHADGDKGGLMYLPRPDVLDIWEELEQARNTLAQVQALHMEVDEKQRSLRDKNNKIEAHTNKSQGAVGNGVGSSGRPKFHQTVISNVSHAQKGMPIAPSHSTQSNKHSTRSKRRIAIQRHNFSFRKMPKQDATGLPSQQPALHVGRPRMPTRHTGSVARGSMVLACCKQDGFYYKGRVVRNISYQSVGIEFLDSSYQTTQLSQLIVIGGAGPRPLLKSEDRVLCCVRQKCGRFCSKYGICDFYIPAQVQEGSGRGRAIFTVVTFDGEQIVCSRSGLEKISKSRYQTTCSLIIQCQQQTNQHSQPEVNACQEKSGEVSTKMPTSKTSDGQDRKDSSSEENVAVAVCHMIPEREDRATVTESPETVERGTNVCASTQEQAVGTGPQKVDQSTSTEVPELTTEVPVLTTLGEGDTTNKDGNDFTDFPVSGHHIFCRWPENGWYYRACVLGRGMAGSSLIVRAESGEVADVPTTDVIAHSVVNPIVVGATVLGPHPLFPGSFAPGNVTSIDSYNSRCFVQLYDGLQTQCQCDEVEFLPLTLYETAVTLLQERDSCWVGQAVVARMDSDGIYYPAVVVDQLVGQHFQLKWSDGSYQKQSILHMFGSHTSHRAIHAGDHVLALAMPGIGACLPGTVIGIPNEGAVEVRFSDGERQKVIKEQCFWISPTYFISAIEYISRAFPSTSN